MNKAFRSLKAWLYFGVHSNFLALLNIYKNDEQHLLTLEKNIFSLATQLVSQYTYLVIFMAAFWVILLVFIFMPYGVNNNIKNLLDPTPNVNLKGLRWIVVYLGDLLLTNK